MCSQGYSDRSSHLHFTGWRREARYLSGSFVVGNRQALETIVAVSMAFEVQIPPVFGSTCNHLGSSLLLNIPVADALHNHLDRRPFRQCLGSIYPWRTDSHPGRQFEAIPLAHTNCLCRFEIFTRQWWPRCASRCERLNSLLSRTVPNVMFSLFGPRSCNIPTEVCLPLCNAPSPWLNMTA